jgi:hypothetical protein
VDVISARKPLCEVGQPRSRPRVLAFSTFVRNSPKRSRRAVRPKTGCCARETDHVGASDSIHGHVGGTPIEFHDDQVFAVVCEGETILQVCNGYSRNFPSANSRNFPRVRAK